jgi:hypothetical protein
MEPNMSAGSHIPYTAPAEFDRNSAQNEKSAVIHAFIALRKADNNLVYFIIFFFFVRKAAILIIAFLNVTKPFSILKLVMLFSTHWTLTGGFFDATILKTCEKTTVSLCSTTKKKL